MIKINSQIKNKLMFKNDDNKYIYADYIGTGQPVPIVENYILTNILPFYANVHSNSKGSLMMTQCIDETKDYIRKVMNMSPDQKLIFTGNGATGAINHIVNSINYNKFIQVNIIISNYEHYSNHIPWVEKSKIYSNIKLFFIPVTKEGIIDYNFLNTLCNKLSKNSNILNIISVTACSNVTGIITDINKIKKIIASTNPNIKLFLDYATLSPYKKINAQLSDAIFISPHKLLGGAQTPGILIANKNLFMNDCPFIPGGGCVKNLNNNEIVYEEDIEIKETAGTPNIIGVIRIKLALLLKESFINTIEHNEKFITKYIHNRFKDLLSRHSNLHVIFLNKQIENRLPIICIYIDDCHHNTIVKILNNHFGIQTRGGIACCGLFAKFMKQHYNITGWCRITFYWLMNIEEIEYIINAVAYISQYHTHLNKYTT